MDIQLETSSVKVERHEHVAVLRLNRPAARNALSESTLKTLNATLDDISDEENSRAIVLASSGPVFSAGHDLKELTAHRADPDKGQAYFSYLLTLCAEVMLKIVHLPQPVIAAIDGIATAAGCQLVASCDLAVAGASSRFCTPGVNIGLFCSTPMVPLSRNLTRKHAMEMLLLGDMVSADDAYRFGLVNRVVADGLAENEALKLAQTITQKSPVSLKIGKRAFYEQIEMSQAEAYRHAAGIMVKNMLAADAIEGIGAFIEKRHPCWPS